MPMNNFQERQSLGKRYYETSQVVIQLTKKDGRVTPDTNILVLSIFTLKLQILMDV